MAPISASQVSLTISGDVLDPTEVTALLSCEPTRIEKKGEIKSPKNARKVYYARAGLWILQSQLPDTSDLEAKIVDVLDKTTKDLVIWTAINQRFTTQVFCGLFINSMNEGFELSTELLNQLGKRNLKIGFDIYSNIRLK